ncbi:ATP-binding protein [Streptomyces sp. DSM 41524]|uniref:ATP-binding protein n=1 Tax=Streptomyces asiaticus subsp. ignotus TaxID=3098222 RepID=A0ABU7Q3T5_9ACTN|nr:ATP-binding protein [Streptomyces sp. DSM 41524]
MASSDSASRLSSTPPGCATAHGSTGLLAHRLDSARIQNFVGRSTELNLFRRALEGCPGAPAVIVLHGPGGIGKSALLQRLALETGAAGRPVVYIDMRMIDPSPAAFKAAASDVFRKKHTVLLVDSFERCPDMEEWLRGWFLPQVPAGVLVVVAGRLPPDPLWRADLAWSDVLQVLPLGELGPADSAALLSSRGADAALHEPLLRFAAGHPLALRLAAEVAAQGQSGDMEWPPVRSVVERLLSHLVGDLPSPAHRRALEVCGHALDTTEELLRVVLPDEDASAMFTWLRQLPFIRCGRFGAYPHDVVRDSLDSDLRWRDPEGYKAMHRAIRGHLVERIRHAPEKEALRATGGYNYIISRGEWIRKFHGSRQESGAFETPFRQEDTDVLVEMTQRVEGAESAAMVAYWLREQPEAFHIHRRHSTGEVLGFMAWLRLESWDEEARSVDPVVTAAWDYVRSAAPLRRGEHLGMARFLVHHGSYHRPSRSWDLVHMRVIFEILRAERCAWSCVVNTDADFWEPLMRYMDMIKAPPSATVGDRSHSLFVHDWRAVRIQEWAERIDTRLLSGPPPLSPADAQPRFASLSRADFDAAVRDALRSWHDPYQLATNPLLQCRLIAEHADDNAVMALRRLIKKAMARLETSPRSAHLYQVLTTTFLARVSTQEAAARRLNMPFSTYRRHLTRGIEQVREYLWRWETGDDVLD